MWAAFVQKHCILCCFNHLSTLIVLENKLWDVIDTKQLSTTKSFNLIISSALRFWKHASRTSIACVFRLQFGEAFYFSHYFPFKLNFQSRVAVDQFSEFYRHKPTSILVSDYLFSLIITKYRKVGRTVLKVNHYF